MIDRKILVIEDDPDIQELVKYNLEKEGYEVSCSSTGEDGLKLARLKNPDLIILDLMLPRMDGLDVCREIKADSKTQSVSIIMLTAKGEESDIVIGLELGADDYIKKPFSPKVLLARIKAVLRRKKGVAVSDPTKLIKIQNLTIHPGKHEVLVDDEKINLTATEFNLLTLLAGRPGWVFTRQQIIDNVRGDDVIITDRAVDVQIVGLRKKLGESGNFIETVRGVGYRFRE
jgi:two-component system alkaline phosphatase synthesis response regulator PhoP